jgi:nitrate reductase (NAD(P)H)
MAGPIGLLAYLGHGKVVVRGEERTLKNLAFIAGGSGITPIYNIIQSSLRHKDGLNLSLLYANHTPADILLKSHLDTLHAENSDNFKLNYTVSRGHDDSWNGFTGRINKEMIAKSIPAP